MLYSAKRPSRTFGCPLAKQKNIKSIFTLYNDFHPVYNGVLVSFIQGTNVMNDEKKKDTLIGSLWVKRFDGRSFTSGVVNGKRVVIRPNKNKKGENSPDWFIFEIGSGDNVEF